MQREIIITADGSQTVFIPGKNITYRSKYGAVQESMHVFINAGLMAFLKKFETVNIFEMGFGTGLNALLSLRESIHQHKKIFYTTCETDPLTIDEIMQLKYAEFLKAPSLQPYFQTMHKCDFEKNILITENFIFHKTQISLADFSSHELFDVIYFDAFAPADVPELWTKKIFEKMFSLLQPDGILVTYCSKGEVRRSLQAAGFSVEKLPGPPGKKEILRAVKKNRPLFFQ